MQGIVGVVNKSKAILRAEADLDSTLVGVLFEGARLSLSPQLVWVPGPKGDVARRRVLSGPKGEAGWVSAARLSTAPKDRAAAAAALKRRAAEAAERDRDYLETFLESDFVANLEAAGGPAAPWLRNLKRRGRARAAVDDDAPPSSDDDGGVAAAARRMGARATATAKPPKVRFSRPSSAAHRTILPPTPTGRTTVDEVLDRRRGRGAPPPPSRHDRSPVDDIMSSLDALLGERRGLPRPKPPPLDLGGVGARLDRRRRRAASRERSRRAPPPEAPSRAAAEEAADFRSMRASHDSIVASIAQQEALLKSLRAKEARVKGVIDAAEREARRAPPPREPASPPSPRYGSPPTSPAMYRYSASPLASPKSPKSYHAPPSPHRVDALRREGLAVAPAVLVRPSWSAPRYVAESPPVAVPPTRHEPEGAASYPLVRVPGGSPARERHYKF